MPDSVPVDKKILSELADIKAMLAMIINPAAQLSAAEKGREMGECIRKYGARSKEVKVLSKKHNGGK